MTKTKEAKWTNARIINFVPSIDRSGYRMQPWLAVKLCVELERTRWGDKETNSHWFELHISSEYSCCWVAIERHTLEDAPLVHAATVFIGKIVNMLGTIDTASLAESQLAIYKLCEILRNAKLSNLIDARRDDIYHDMKPLLECEREQRKARIATYVTPQQSVQ